MQGGKLGFSVLPKNTLTCGQLEPGSNRQLYSNGTTRTTNWATATPMLSLTTWLEREPFYCIPVVFWSTACYIYFITSRKHVTQTHDWQTYQTWAWFPWLWISYMSAYFNSRDMWMRPKVPVMPVPRRNAVKDRTWHCLTMYARWLACESRCFFSEVLLISRTSGPGYRHYVCLAGWLRLSKANLLQLFHLICRHVTHPTPNFSKSYMTSFI